MNGIAALLEQGRYLAAQTDAFPSTTETVEALNHAQEGIEEVAKNPGIIRTWLEGLVPDLLNFAFQILIALLVYVIGGRIIKWITKLVRRSMDRAGTDEGVKQFMIPVIKYSLYVVCILDLCKRILHAVRRGDKKQLVRPPLVAVDVQQIILDRRVRHEEQHQVHPCDTEIYASGGIRIVMLQKDRQLR